MLAEIRSLFLRAWDLLLDNPVLFLMGILLNMFTLVTVFSASAALAPLVLLLWIVAFVVQFRVTAGVIGGVNYAALNGQRLEFGKLWQTGRARMWVVLGVNLWFGLYIVIPLLIFLIAVLFVGLIARLPLSYLSDLGSGKAQIDAIWAILFGICLWAFTSVFIAASELGTQVGVLEPVNSSTAVRTGWRIYTFGRNFRIVALIAIALSVLRYIPVFINDTLSTLIGADPFMTVTREFSLGSFLVRLVDVLFLTALTAPVTIFSLLVWTVFYRQLRATQPVLMPLPNSSATTPLPPASWATVALDAPETGNTVQLPAEPNRQRMVLQWVGAVVILALLLWGSVALAAAIA